ncbi:MAG: type II toxin-antitoxin system VapC family toxin [Nitrososphaerales archaeon]
MDSDILVAILRNAKEARGTVEELDSEGTNATTSINAFEVFYGAYRSTRKEQNIAEARKLFQRLEVIPFDFESSLVAGELAAELALDGSILDFRDAMIAGIALSNDLSLVTRNKKHFERIDKLKIESW